MKIVLNDGTEIPIEKVFIIETMPGDVMLLKHPGHLTRTAIDNIRQSFYNELGIKVAVLEEGMEPHSILRKNQNDETLHSDPG